MSGKTKSNKDIAAQENEIFNAMINFEYQPIIQEEQAKLNTYMKLSLSQVTTLGTAFEPLSIAFQNVIKGAESTSGLYHVKIPKGAQLAKFKNGSGFLGSVLKENGAVGGGQAILNPLVFNPATLIMAATIASINRKLDIMQETQDAILNFLVHKERAELEGDLKTLEEIHENYKYNWNDDTFKESNRNIVLFIKKDAVRKIAFFRKQISSEISKKNFIYSDQWVKKKIDSIEGDFKDYQLALYIYSYSQVLDIILSEKFDSDYIASISKKIEEYTSNYNMLNDLSYEYIEKHVYSSFQSRFYKGTAKVSTGIEENFAFDQNLKGLIGKTLVLGNEKLEKNHSESINYSINQFNQTLEKHNEYVRPFLEDLKTLDKLYNQPVELIFDKENIYIGQSMNNNDSFANKQEDNKFNSNQG